MAFTDPRTWNAGETVTSSMLNTYIRDNQNSLKNRAIVCGIGSAGGGVISTGVKWYIPIPYALTITGWTLVADQSGSIVLDVWLDTYANFPPTVADTIAGSEKPTLSTAQKNQDLSLTTWTTSIPAGSILGINVDSVTDINSVVLVLQCVVA